ncbi:glycosyltransferase [Paractinoplanes rhizophilus]|uniref:Glycosyltransferase n=1 Tax=Paractinoplanes rhizophilus TaxID=1416877 RepID=A0ABW2HSQ8_9ACTN
MVVTPRLSIVVPFYNVERYIADCLDSLARQTLGDFEVILVDDGSKDASVEAARDFCARDGRFRIVTQENQGLGPARNTGVQHAQGDYLTFVDSDDLVPRHAYEIMVRSLDATSSSLAAGNARRFNNTYGVRQSYVHRIPFAANKPATHVFDHPSLATDRMVWNKVYRRTFWDQFKFEFPAIRYEDYPITLRAHLEAITVDCVAAPVYYWRERESGESITQLKFQYGNLADRVTSAEMVLDLLDKRAHELRGLVHRHFAEMDLATIVQAFATADDDDLGPLVALGRRLSSRLLPEVLAEATTFQRLEYEALEAGDTDLLRRLARFRAENHRRVEAVRHPTLPWRYESQYPGLRDSQLPSSYYRLPRAELAVRTSVTALDWTGDDLVLHGTAEIAHLPVDTTNTTLRLALVCGRREHRLPVTLTDRPGPEEPLAFETRIPRRVIAGLPDWAKSAWIAVDMRSGWVRRRDALTPGGLGYPLGDRVGGKWVQPVRTPDGRLTLQLRSGTPELTAAGVDGDDLVLTGRIPARLSRPELRLTRSAGDIVVPLRRERGVVAPGQREVTMDDFTARVALDDLIDAVNPDDPFLDRTVLVPRIHDGADQTLLLITGLRAGVMAARGGRVITVSRSPGQYLNLIEGPARVTADRIERSADTRRLTVSGPRWPGVSYDRITWRRFLPNSDEGIDAPCAITLGDDRWSAEADAGAMTGVGDAPNWTLFADPGDATPYAVQTDSFLLARLPLRVGPFTLRPRSGILHLETD